MNQQKQTEKRTKPNKDYSEQGFLIDKEKQTKLYCVLSYIYILWIVGLLVNKKDPKVKFHVNQGIILSIFFFSSLFIIQLLSIVLFFIAPILTFFSSFLQIIWIVLSVTFMYIGIKNVLNDKMEPLPFIGELFTVIH